MEAGSVKRKKVEIEFDVIGFAIDLAVASTVGIIVFWCLKPVWLPFLQDLWGKP